MIVYFFQSFLGVCLCYYTVYAFFSVNVFAEHSNVHEFSMLGRRLSRTGSGKR